MVMYKIDRRGGGGGGVQKSFSRTDLKGFLRGAQCCQGGATKKCCAPLTKMLSYAPGPLPIPQPPTPPPHRYYRVLVHLKLFIYIFFLKRGGWT